MVALVEFGEIGLHAGRQDNAAGGDDFAVFERRAEMIAPVFERGDAARGDLRAIAARMNGHSLDKHLADEAGGKSRTIRGAPHPYTASRTQNRHATSRERGGPQRELVGD